MDIAAWREAGLYDPDAPTAADRLALLEFLSEQGCDLEEMVEAEARDRLFALAGDRMIRPAPAIRLRHRSGSAGGHPGRDRTRLALLRSAYSHSTGTGRPRPCGAAHVAADPRPSRRGAATALARVLGSGAARLAEAEAAAMRAGLGGTVDRSLSGSEAVTARAYAEVTSLIPQIGVVLDSVHRHHIEAARRHFELVAPTPDTMRCGVGFADLSGFTAMSSAMPLSALSKLLAAFEDVTTETVNALGGRVVKFLGDAVMYVTPDVPALATIACALVDHPDAAEAHLQVRAGIAYGDVLAQDGDYFGPPVNLAARLVSLASPGDVLAAPSVVPLLNFDHDATPREPAVLRGIAEPVTPYAITRPSPR